MKKCLWTFVVAAVVFAGGCRKDWQTLRIGYSPDLPHATALIGIADQTFKDIGGLDIEPEVFVGGADAIEALMFGDVDIVYVDPLSAIFAVSQSENACVIVSGAAEGGSALLVSSSSAVSSMQDLKEATIAVPFTGSLQELSLRYELGQLGMLTYELDGNLKIVEMPNSELAGKFLLGELPAAWTIEPWVSQLQKSVKAKILLDEATLWHNEQTLVSYPSSLILMRKALIKQRPDVAKEFLKRHAALTDWINKNPGLAQVKLSKAIEKITGNAVSDEAMSQAMTRVAFATEISTGSLHLCAKKAFRVGYISEEAADTKNFVQQKLLSELK